MFHKLHIHKIMVLRGYR